MSDISSEIFIATMREKNVFAAIEQLQAGFGADPAANSELYHKTMLDAYWKRKTLPAVVALGASGIQYALTHAQFPTNSGAARELRSLAKAMSYDLASFTWPGWDEPGITPT